MEKYQGLSEITYEYFHAHLSNLNINYETEDYVNIHIEYSDDVYHYDYDLGIDKNTHERSFLKHDCIGHGAETHLLRNVAFEEAVEQYLFNKKDN